MSRLGTMVVRIAADMLRYKADLEGAVATTSAAAEKIEQSTKKVGESARKGFGEAGAAAQQSAQKQVDAARQVADATAMQVSAVKSLGLAYAAYKAVDLARDMTMLNARHQELGVVMAVVGKNAGYTAQQMAGYAAETQKMGISMIESRNTVIQLAQAEINLADASKLARVAQDAAVIGNTNSSAALATMIHGIKSAQTDVLRSIGINVNFEQSYKDLAASLGVKTSALSEQQKMQARQNSVMEEGTKLVGAYEAAMDTAGKQVRSMTRYTEDLKVMGGEVFNETLTVAVMAFVGQLKDANGEVTALAKNGALREWGNDVADTFAFVVDAGLSVVSVTKMIGATLGWMAARAANGNYAGAKKEDVAAAAKVIDAAYLADLERYRSGASVMRDALAKRRSAHAETAAGIASTEKQYLAAQLVVQKAYENESLARQQAAQLALRNAYFAADPSAPKGRAVTPDPDTVKASAAAVKQAIKEAESGLKAYDDLMNKESGFTASFNETVLSMVAARDKGKISAEQYTAAIAELMKIQPGTIALEKESAACMLESAKAYESNYQAAQKYIDTTTAEAAKLEEQNAAFNLSAEALAQLTAQRQIDQATMLDGIAIKKLDRDLDYDSYDATKRLTSAMRQNAANTLAKPGIDAAEKIAEANKEAAKESGKFWEDALMRAFESGKGFFQSLWDTIKNTLKTQVLRVTVQGVMGSLGLGAAGAANAQGAGSSALSMLGNVASLSNLYSAGAATYALGSQVLAGTMSVANGLGTLAANATGTGISGLLATNAAYGTAAAGSASAVTGSVMTSLAAIPVWGWVAMAAVAITALGGRGEKQLTGEGGISGTLSANGPAAVQQYAVWKQDGGWFHSDRSGRAMTAVSADTRKVLDQATVGITQITQAYAASIGLSADAVKGYTQAIDISLGGLSPEKQQEAISKALSGFADGMADSAYKAALAVYAKDGEIVSATLARLSSSLTVTNSWLSILRMRVLGISTAGADAASKLADYMGGLENLSAASNAYYEAYFSAAEKSADGTRAMTAALAGVNLVLPDSKDAYRALAEGLDLNTDAGRRAYAVLLTLAPQFDAAAQAASKMAADTAAQLIKTFSGDQQLIPLLAGTLTGINAVSAGLGGFGGTAYTINLLLGDASSGVLTFGERVEGLSMPLDGAQLAALGLADQIFNLKQNASSAVIDIAGLSAALANVNTETFMLTMAGVFEALAGRLKTVLGDIGNERVAVRDAALSIINPTVMSKDQITRGIAGANVGMPSNAWLVAAKSGLSVADAAVAKAGTALQLAQATSGKAQADIADAKTYQTALIAKVNQGIAGIWSLASAYGLSLGDGSGGAARFAVNSDGKFEAVYNVISGNDANFAPYKRDFYTSGGVYDQTYGQAEALNSAAGNVSNTQSLAKSAAAAISPAQSAYTASLAAQTTALAAAKAAELAYIDSLQNYAIDAGKATAKLSRLREETVKYYESQKALSDLMSTSAKSLRQTVADYRYAQLDPGQQYEQLQGQFNTAYSLALSTSGDTLAGYGDKLSALLNPMLDKAKEAGLSDSAYNQIAAVSLARAEAVAARIEAMAPTNYAADSLAMLGQIDSTLAALEDGSRSSDRIIVDAINAGRDQTVGGLRAVVAALTGQSIPGFASGGDFGGGLRIVGERGMELEATGPSRIFNASQTRSILSGGGNDAMVQELRALRQEVAQLRAENRAGHAATAGNTGKLAKIADREYVEGKLVRADADQPLFTVAA